AETRLEQGGQIHLSGEDDQLENLPLLRRVVEQSDPRVVPGTLVVVDVESVKDPDSCALEEPPPRRAVLEKCEQLSGIASGVEVDDVDDRLRHDAAESVLDHGPVVLGWQHVEDEMLEDPVLDESWEGDVPVGRLGPGEDGESDRSGAGQF